MRNPKGRKVLLIVVDVSSPDELISTATSIELDFFGVTPRNLSAQEKVALGAHAFDPRAKRI